MNAKAILDTAKRTIGLEAAAIDGLQAFLNDDFARAVELVYKCNGRLVVSGIGKSAIIAQKMVATFNSTGTPSLYMHAADAIHGDLGMIHQDDRHGRVLLHITARSPPSRKRGAARTAAALSWVKTTRKLTSLFSRHGLCSVPAMASE